MVMPNFVRKLCPSKIGLGYGYWCGAVRTHASRYEAEPIDDGDMACMLHDFTLRTAQTEDDKHKADAILWKSWKNYKPKSIYGKIYRILILATFKNKYCED